MAILVLFLPARHESLSSAGAPNIGFDRPGGDVALSDGHDDGLLVIDPYPPRRDSWHSGHDRIHQVVFAEG
jgi:hypothetical protein